MAMQALVMGFGGTGAHILTSLKELTVLKYGSVPETIRFLLFDTIADWEPGKAVQIVGGAAEERTAKSEDEAASLDPRTEYFQLADFAPDLRTHVFNYLDSRRNPEAYPHLKDWLHAPWLGENVPVHQLGITIGAAQQRQIGRYAMFKNAEKILAHLRPIITKLAAVADGADVNVWLIGSSAGGTGAGCLIDAAYLTKLAASKLKSPANENIKIKVTGVIVLPNVYMNVRGISQGRAYSLLRELERVQEQGIPEADKYLDISKDGLVSSRVVYDKNAQQMALIESRLFDDLFYLGSACPTEDDRRKFFTSVASAIDPYLDDESGPALLEKAVNENAAASAFGGARVYVPSETLTEIFAWEQVAEYLRRVAAPIEVGDRVVGLHAGKDQDREDTASDKFRSLLALFKELLDLEDKTDRAKEVFARDELDGRRIVTLWYELTGTRTPEELAMLLTYVEPCYSLTQPERPKETKEWALKTYRENAAEKNGLKEKQEDSRGRFADKLEEIKRRYTNPNGGAGTFENGRRHVLDTISKRLNSDIDNLFIQELTRRRGEFAQSLNAPEQGTPLTQLLAEVTWMLSDKGPLRRVHAVIGQFVAAVAKEQAERNNVYTRALQELRESKKSGMFDFGAWVEGYQQSARDECTNYIRWYQKHELLKDMQELVLNVEKRLREWESLLEQIFDKLVRRESRDPGETSALFYVTQIQLKGTLYERLHRAAHNRTALISFGREPDPQMHGYREELRNQAAQGLVTNLVNKSHWEAVRTPEGAPAISLVIAPIDNQEEQRYSARNMRELPQKLYAIFKKHIKEKMGNTDIFNYLEWVREHRGIQPETIVRLLDNAATPLINAGAVPETRTLVFRNPTGDSKKDLAASIMLNFGTLEGIERNYSDRNAIALVKVKKPSLDEIVDIQECRADYLTLRSGRPNNNEAHDKELRRAQVFHPFRQELEAWYIERSYLNRMKLRDVPTLPPRVARLLEDPEMLQNFVRGIATEAVEFTNGGWIWHGPDRDLVLTTDRDDPDADVVKAAVIFSLKQAEGRRDTLVPISRDAAENSVNKSAQRKGKTSAEMVATFLNGRLDNFLNAHAPEHLREPLKMVFAFYCDLKTRTALQHRVNLP